MAGKNNWRLHTARLKRLSSIFISFYLIWLQESWQTFILWDDRFIHTKAHYHSALKWLCVCWHQPSWRKLNGPKYFEDRFFFSHQVQSLRNASGQDSFRFKRCKKMEIWTWYDSIYLLILFSVFVRPCNRVYASESQGVHNQESRPTVAMTINKYQSNSSSG